LGEGGVERGGGGMGFSIGPCNSKGVGYSWSRTHQSRNSHAKRKEGELPIVGGARKETNGTGRETDVLPTSWVTGVGAGQRELRARKVSGMGKKDS